MNTSGLEGGREKCPSRRVGLLSTRFEGTDGVSLETEKWIHVLKTLNCDCFYFAGSCDWDPEHSFIVPEANFKHPDIQRLNEIAFSYRTRPLEVSQKIQQLKDYLKQKIYDFVRTFDLEILIVENALAIPLNIPLGLALTEFVAETGLPMIAHHHDFFWERKRFLVNCVWDYFNMAFPPHLPSIHHVVINSSGANQLSLRTGISSMLIPNVMDFDTPPGPPDTYSSDVRSALGLFPDEMLFLQPTRVVPRKGIEHAIELTRRLGKKAQLVISHASGDEGYEYEKRLKEFAEMLEVKVKFEADIIRNDRGLVNGRKIYTLADLYQHCDLVTYPSDIEGFGNAFLEAVYYRRPIVVNNYSIFDTDIKPKGFQVIEFDGYITDQTIEHTRQVLENKALFEEIAEHNYQLARRHYSYTMLRRRLQTLLADCFGEEIQC
ncbi:MAG: glycosyltransferase family 4 protein [Anaerolineae bacterium]|nr:glycosyltransferase family 4 protein [Anaerolineae bacterium]